MAVQRPSFRSSTNAAAEPLTLTHGGWWRGRRTVHSTLHADGWALLGTRWDRQQEDAMQLSGP